MKKNTKKNVYTRITESLCCTPGTKHSTESQLYFFFFLSTLKNAIPELHLFLKKKV